MAWTDIEDTIDNIESKVEDIERTIDKMDECLEKLESTIESKIEEEGAKTRALIKGIAIAIFVVVPFIDHVVTPFVTDVVAPFVTDAACRAGFLSPTGTYCWR
jgi:benzoyl-CoA reductase/2-hydroxyglutaryl-CoA dehydratase subunit BcrC/BadD/HgdB